MLRLKRAAVVGVAFALLAFVGQVANAGGGRSIRVDALDKFNDNTGEYWPSPDRHSFTLDCRVCPDRLDEHFGLSLNTSGSPFGEMADSFLIDNNRLSNRLGEVPGALKIFLNGVRETIVPFYFASPADGAVTWNSVEWARGIIDAEAPFNESEAVTAIRLTWHGTLADSSVVDAQIVLLDRSNGGDRGDFDLELNYGRDSFGYPPGAMQGIYLNGFERDVPLADGTAIYNLSYRAGAPVPEPGTVWLLAAGLALLSGAGVLRRKTAGRGIG